MIIIAHRGNTEGPKPDFENSPTYILEALSKGFHVEIDVWLKVINKRKEIFLGHDEPQYHIQDLKLLFDNKSSLWCHAKNIEALEWLLLNDFHCFWHQEDNYTITSKGYIWAYPNMPTKIGIYVMPERENTVINKDEVLGVCTDYCYRYSDSF